MRVLLFTIIAIGLCAAPSMAQSPGPTKYNYFNFDRSEYADPQYRAMVRKAQRMPRNFSFGVLRRLYMQSSHYTPVSDDISRQLIDASNRLAQAKDGEAVYKALQDAKAILRDHAGNLGIVMIGESLSQSDPRYGDPRFYTWLYKGLMQDVLNSGDGQTPEGAYDVITMEEEAALLRTLNLHVLGMETVEEGIMYFNMYTVASPDGGAPESLFVNATYPLSKERKNARDRVKELDIFR